MRRRKPILENAANELNKRYKFQMNKSKYTRIVHTHNSLFNRERAAHPENEKDIFAGQPIGIFKAVDQLEVKDDTLNTWNKLETHELRLKMSMHPRNYFEKMAYWTEEGKIWHFPIDNEQGKLKLNDKLKQSKL